MDARDATLELIRPHGGTLKDLYLSEAEAEAESPESESAARRVVRSPRYQLKPLAVEDALSNLEENDEEILVYRDASSDRINVVYRRRDGDIGLIEPEF